MSLFWNISEDASGRDRAVDQIKTELPRITQLVEAFGRRVEQLNQWDGVKLQYPSEEFELCLNQLSSAEEEGREIERELNSIVNLASWNRTGLTGTFRKTLKGLNRTQKQVADLKAQLLAFKARAEAAPEKMDQGCQQEPEQAELIGDQPPEQLRFCCCGCGQPLEVNASAVGQAFKCPSCGCDLTVPEH